MDNKPELPVAMIDPQQMADDGAVSLTRNRKVGANSIVNIAVTSLRRPEDEIFMRALCWHGTGDVRVDSFTDPRIRDPRDAIVRISATGICGSDLEKGDVLAHEPMGEVVKVGNAIRNLRPGDRVAVPFTISCGECFFCKKTLCSLCDTSNPNAEIARKAMGHSPAALFGYSHMLDGVPGAQAEYLRVLFADAGPIKIEAGLPDEKALFLSDIFPTRYMAAENCDIEQGDTVCGAAALSHSSPFKASGCSEPVESQDIS